MLNRLITIVTAAALMIGCASSAPPAAQPAPAPAAAAAPAPKPAPKAEAPAFTVNSTGWDLVKSDKLAADSDEPALLAMYKQDIDEESSAVAVVLGVNIPKDSSVEAFIGDVRDSLQGRQDAKLSKILKERMIKLGSTPAYEEIEIRVTQSGPAAVVLVAASNGKVGYVVQCGVPLENAKEWIGTCGKFVESFRITSK